MNSARRGAGYTGFTAGCFGRFHLPFVEGENVLGDCYAFSERSNTIQA